jgi:hypothetical protein
MNCDKFELYYNKKKLFEERYTVSINSNFYKGLGKKKYKTDKKDEK